MANSRKFISVVCALALFCAVSAASPVAADIVDIGPPLAPVLSGPPNGSNQSGTSITLLNHLEFR